MITGLSLIAAVLAQSITDACGVDPGWWCERFYDLTGNETVAEIAQIVLGKLLVVIFILFLAYLANRVLRTVIMRTTDRVVARNQERETAAAAEAEAAAVPDEHEDEFTAARRLKNALARATKVERASQRANTLGALLRSLATIVIYLIAAVTILGEFDINIGPLIASAGIVGIALGFGAQSLVKDFLSGIFMLAEDQYGVGDIIDVGDASGIVEEVSLRVTRLRDVHGTVWWVPNGEIRRVGNKSQQWARAVLDIDVAYDTDLAHAMSVIKRVADGVWADRLEKATVLEEPEIWGVERFGDNAISIRLVLKVEPAEQWSTARLVRGRIKEAFDGEGIEIPFPQRTVWMKTDPGVPDQRPSRDPSYLDRAGGAAEEPS
jgi:small conductance mechanosensitive channel